MHLAGRKAVSLEKRCRCSRKSEPQHLSVSAWSCGLGQLTCQYWNNNTFCWEQQWDRPCLEAPSTCGFKKEKTRVGWRPGMSRKVRSTESPASELRVQPHGREALSR